MSTLDITSTVGEIVAQRPAATRAFERIGIDYCCGGKRTLQTACAEKGLDAATVLAMLDTVETVGGSASSAIDTASMSLTELADHIEQTHHAYLREELPRLDGITAKVKEVHGESDARLLQVRDIYAGLFEELTNHMMKEERILFPLIRQLNQGSTGGFHCGSIGNPIRQMEVEHDSAGDALHRMRELTDDFTPPEWACPTYRGMLEGLAQLERDTHQHISKENNVLFPRAIAQEADKN